MNRISYLIFLVTIFVGLTACSNKQADRTQETTEAEEAKKERDSLVEEIKVHPADSTVMEEKKEDTSKDSLPIIVIKRGSCLGNCPVYEARLYKDGQAEFRGKEYVDLIGSYTAQVDSTTIQDIYEKVEFIDYFSLADRYPVESEPISDLPNTITTVRKDGNEKTIVNNSRAPRELTDFEGYLERTFLNLDWEPVSSSDAKD